MFAEALQFLCAKPLSPKRLGSVILKKGGQLCWAEYGEVEKSKVRHTILYFHGAPGCRFEPMMHSNRRQDKREIQKNKSGTVKDDLGGMISGSPTNRCNENRNDVNRSIRDDSGIDRKTTIGAKNNPLEKEIREDCSVIDLDDALDVYSRRGIRLICVERPGFGESTYQESRTVADYVDDIIELTNNEEMNLFPDYSSDNRYERNSNGSSGRIQKTISDNDDDTKDFNSLSKNHNNNEKSGDVRSSFTSHNGNSSIDSTSTCPGTNESSTNASISSGLHYESSKSNDNSSKDGNEKKNVQKKLTYNDGKEVKIYVIGYSAGAPYAIAMRYLFEKYQMKNQDKNNDDNKDHRICTHANYDNLRQPIKLVAVCAVAGSVSAADNILYQNSLEGKVLNSFFSLPLKAQSFFYSAGTHSVIIGLQVVIKGLSLANSVMNTFQIGMKSVTQTDSRDDLIKNSDVNYKIIKNKISQEDNNIENNEKCEDRKIGYQIKTKIANTTNPSIVILKLCAIEKALSTSLRTCGGKAMVVDTLATQWIGRPWGFDLNSSSNTTMSSTSASTATSTTHLNSNLEFSELRVIDDDSKLLNKIPGIQSPKIFEAPHKNTEFSNRTNELPPLLLYYSKDDSTVPSDMGLWLSEKTLGVGTEPVWLSGGHSCFILHLDRILDDLIKIK